MLQRSRWSQWVNQWYLSPITMVVLMLAMALPLMGFVMLGGSPSDLSLRWVLLPAIPATIMLYGMCMWRWRSSWMAMIGATLVFFWLLIAVIVPYLPLTDPNSPITGANYTQPFSQFQDQFFWLGADFRGRDLLARTLWGSQRVLVWGIVATMVAYVIGTLMGLLAGYVAGWVDELISFMANVLLSFPIMVLYILILTYVGQGGFNIVIAVTFASAPSIMRIVRGLTFDIKNRDYVFAAQTRGESVLYILLIELLPNVRGPIIVDACLRLGYTTVAITTLTFLGLGLQPPDPDWGLMIKEAAPQAKLLDFAYMLIVPSVAVSSLILGFNMMADGLRDLSMRG